MLRDLKPCIRCEGSGTVKILIDDPDSPGQSVAGMSKCHGCNGTGQVPKVQREETPGTEGAA